MSNIIEDVWEISGINRDTGAISIASGKFVIAFVNPGLESIGIDLYPIAERIVNDHNQQKAANEQD